TSSSIYPLPISGGALVVLEAFASISNRAESTHFGCPAIFSSEWPQSTSQAAASKIRIGIARDERPPPGATWKQHPFSSGGLVLTLATSNSSSRGGSRRGTSDRLSVGFSFTLSITRTGAGAVFSVRLKPSCFSTAAKIVGRAAPPCNTCERWFHLKSKSQAPS